jgi:hypothetical protein
VAKKKGLALVKHLIKELSPKDRAQLFSYLAEFPDSGVQSYDLREEVEYLKKHGKRVTGPNDDEDYCIVNLVFVRNLVSVQVLDTEILRAVFFPDNFIAAFPRSRRTSPLFAQKFQQILFTEERKAATREMRKEQGVVETDAQFEAHIKNTCEEIGLYWMTEKAKRIAEQISLHLPGMVGDMMAAAIKGQTFHDLAQLARETPDKAPSLKEFKKLIQDSAWREIKPHLQTSRGIRTPTDWRGDEQVKKYAERVSERRLLATCIKDKYLECDEAPGWISDLKEDPNFNKLSAGIAQDALNRAIRRAADDSLSDRERQPLSIALDMARFELELSELDIETLGNKYDVGNKLLKAARAERSKESGI